MSSSIDGQLPKELTGVNFSRVMATKFVVEIINFVKTINSVETT